MSKLLASKHDEVLQAFIKLIHKHLWAILWDTIILDESAL
jgi:hypothetical protein